MTRINITLPAPLAKELKREASKRGKSGYIAAAIAEKIRRERRARAWKKLENLPATFTHIDDSAEYIHRIRREDDKKRIAKR